MNTKRNLWRVLSLLTLLILAACGPGETPAPTLDTTLIFTQAAETVAVQLTITAAAQPSNTPLPTQVPATLTPAPTLDGSASAAPTQFLLNTPSIFPSATLALLPQATATGALCNNSAYVADIGVKDGTVLKAGEAFAKGWLVQNTGTCEWTIGYYLVRTGGNTDFNAAPYVIRTSADVVSPGEIAEISMRMVAPKAPGKYEAFYQMYSNLDIPFGTGLSVSIEVKK